MTQRPLFLQHIAQTSPNPIGIEADRAEGIYIYDRAGRRYTDLIAGVAVSNVGHCHPKVVAAVQAQAARYMHLMVYGEYIQSPQVLFAQALASVLPAPLDCVYFVNSGAEANEGALKLAKRYTGRTEIVAFRNAYHGGTHGALSATGNEELRNAFRPLLPDIRYLTFNAFDDLPQITERTACVLVEPIQGEAGVRLPAAGFLQALQARCRDTGALLAFDEVQTGFGRTGAWFAAIRYGVTPDIITLAKAMGGGMPLGAFVASRSIMETLQSRPALGHITTFGGHPVSCAAALAAWQVLHDENRLSEVEGKAALFRRLLQHPAIREIRGEGLMLAAELADAAMLRPAVAALLQQGIITEWFLFCDTAFRIAPPLIISHEEISDACRTICDVLTRITNACRT
ncbi:MAG: aminotransferase class III-fold pyridoxal phosphate-dependent enzyme [Prevotellaceae bacterium]|jgi:acetylornithine/succinyldiaminopimelate/putrescine aminotransferase|nr:aminotransferase class III-fold pyridoxal phosphate-dependent enzyme [Prevotellaceae bacterium]